MGNDPIDRPEIETIANAHVRRIVAALAEMSVKDVKHLVDEIETEIGPDEIDVRK